MEVCGRAEKVKVVDLGSLWHSRLCVETVVCPSSHIGQFKSLSWGPLASQVLSKEMSNFIRLSIKEMSISG